MLPRAPRRFDRTTLLTVGLIASLSGIALGKSGIETQGALVCVIAVLTFAFFRRRGWLALGFMVVLGLGLGLFRGNQALRALKPYEALYGQKVVLQVVASEDAAYGTSSQLTFDATNIRSIKPSGYTLPGRLKIAGFGEHMIYRGDVVEVEGKLSPTRGGRQGQMSFANLQLRAHRQSFVDKARREFATGMQNALPEPAASFGLGLLIGQRSTLPDDVSKQLAAVGLTHLIAVSGYNLTIIVDAVRRLTAKLSKYQGTVMALGLVGLFLLTTGMSASIVRASIVSGLGIWAWYYGRTIKPLLLIAVAAALTAGWNPLYLWGDIGWYLSFLAFFGVLVIAPLVTRRIYGERQPKFLQAILIEAACAQVMTLPLILFIFQQVSLVSLLANMLVVPLVPLAMVMSVIAGIAGVFMPGAAGWLAWPAKSVLTYMLDIAALLSRIPHALAQYALSLPGLLFLYGVIIALTTVLWRKVAQKHGIITGKEAVQGKEY